MLQRLSVLNRFLPAWIGAAMLVAMRFNWLIGPVVMFTLAWLLLADLPS